MSRDSFLFSLSFYLRYISNIQMYLYSQDILNILVPGRKKGTKRKGSSEGNDSMVHLSNTFKKSVLSSWGKFVISLSSDSKR
jgi:hypothetical protein